MLDSADAVIKYASTMTWKGKHPVVELVTRIYQTGVKLTKEAMEAVETHLQRLPSFTSLQAQRQAISARTIYEECGLAYASIRRNPKALLLYQQYSTFLKRERKRTKIPCPDAVAPRDPLLAYKKAQLAIMIREERARQQETEQQQA